MNAKITCDHGNLLSEPCEECVADTPVYTTRQAIDMIREALDEMDRHKHVKGKACAACNQLVAKMDEEP